MSGSDFKVENIFDVRGKVVVVTGGGTGLGKAITAGFIQNGAKVYITGRRQEVLEATAKEIGGDIVSIKGDVSTKEGCSAIANAFAAKESKLDVLINCAGVLRGWQTGVKDHNNADEVEKLLWEGHDDDDFNYSNSINVNGVYFMTAALVPYLRKSEDPSVVVIASIAGLANQRAMASVSYSVSKVTIQLSRLLAGRLHPMKIRVNTICPGIFPSEMTGKSDAGEGLEYDLNEASFKAGKRSTIGRPFIYVASSRAKSFIGRPGKPEEIVGPVLLLSSKAGGFFDGAMLTVDGGRLMATGINDGIRLPEDTYV
ncbi:uncharacterized protein L203_106447 [Cryptococcus depauperatus CBS 7841]|uniref:Rhamnolipids biosynthesis 3-oxoacyl-[acyl-carrier-protein] reductase n=1 Tax=Cryptococcus depauperatus CBS 7841 TaxID=1295531 RepID=A0AAJ8JZD2_9TREE